MMSLRFLCATLSIAAALFNNNAVLSVSAFGISSDTASRSSQANLALSFSPVEVADAASQHISMEIAMNPDVDAQVLMDGSHFLMDFPFLFNSSKIRMQYAQLIGRLMVISIGFLPGHGFHAEEIGVQLFLLGSNLKPIIRSIKLLYCISSSRSSCTEECSLEFMEDIRPAFESSSSNRS